MAQRDRVTDRSAGVSGSEMSVSLRPYAADDAFLLGLYASTRAEELAFLGWDAAQRLAFIQMQYRAQQQSYLAQFPAAEYRIIRQDAADVGRLIVDRSSDVVWLVDISLLPEQRNAGLGTALIRVLQVEAAGVGKPVALHVAKANRALRLYERLGFRPATGDGCHADGIYLEMIWRPSPARSVTGASGDSVADAIVAFLIGIGLGVRAGEIGGETFLPGIQVDHGGLLVDAARLKYPGDLLHEAGHLAVMSPARRRRAHIDVGKRAAEEIAAIAWSYAALVHLGLDPAVVFHPDGYRGGSQALIENFTGGHTIGVPMLQWLGLTLDAGRAAETGDAPYPAMLKWLCDEERP
jgi:GNAT superfamily N-acetyltransferase